MRLIKAIAVFVLLVLSSPSCLAQVLTGINSPEDKNGASTRRESSGGLVSPLDNPSSSPRSDNDIMITRVWPNKVFYRPGETATVDIQIHNKSSQQRQCVLKCRTLQEINESQLLFVRDVELLPGQTMDIKQEFAVDGLAAGVEIRASLTEGDESVCERSEYFAVGENPLALGQYLVVGTTRGRAKAYREKIIPEIRENYINCIEWYSWSPDTFGAFVPDNKYWRASQTKYPEGMNGARAMIDTAHKNGMSVFSYVKNSSYGPIGFDLARRNPELVLYNVWGQFCGDGMGTRDTVRELAYKSPGLKEMAVVEWNFADPKSVELGTNAWLDGAKVLGYDGVRFDGHYLATGPGSSSGSALNVHGRDPNGGVDYSVLSARNQKLMKAICEKKRPGFLFGFNYGFSYDKAGVYAPEAFRIAAENSMIMWENAQGWARTGKSWNVFVENVKKETDIVLANNGHLYGIIIEGSPVFNGYAAALAIASRGHISSMKNMKRWYRFATRNAAFIYDQRIQEIASPRRAIRLKSKGNILYKRFAYRRDISETRQQYITHLVNVPNDVIDKKAQRFPSPVSDIRFTYSVKPQQKVRKVYWAQAGGTEERWIELPWKRVRNRIVVKIPSLNLWGIVLIDCEEKQAE